MPVAPFAVLKPDPAVAIIELFGGDNNLSPYVEEDMSEMVLGATGDIAIICIADVYKGPAKVVEITPGVGVRVLEDLGEIDTGDPAVLAGLLARALVSYPAAGRLAIGFWDHGSGVFDEADRNPLRQAFPRARLPRWRQSRAHPARNLFFGDAMLAEDVHLRAMLHDDDSGGLLTNREAGKMLASAFSQAGRDAPVDLIFSDTCLNGMAEVVVELAPYADYIVGSEELEPGDGWDYFEWLSRVSASPAADGRTLAVQAVEAMEAGYLHRPDLIFPRKSGRG